MDFPYNGNASLWMETITANPYTYKFSLRAYTGLLQIPYGAGTGTFPIFRLKPWTVGITGLYGCTVVIISSRQHAGFFHAWESPAFMSDAAFQMDVMNWLGSRPFNPAFLSFFAKDNIRVWIFSPRPHGTTDSNPIGGQLLYQDKLNQLSARVATIFPGSPIQMFGYLKTNKETSEGFNSAKGKSTDPDSTDVHKSWHFQSL